MFDGRIVLLPFMAQGHFNAFVNFANFLHKHHPSSCTIVMATTPLNTTKLRSMMPDSPQIDFAVLPFDAAAHGLPRDGECTDGLPPHLVNRLIGATHTMKPALQKLLSDLLELQYDAVSDVRCRRVSMISDVFCSWAVEMAEKLGIFHAVLSTGGAFGTATTFTVWQNLPMTVPKSSDGDEEFELVDWPGMRLHQSQLNHNVKASTGTDACTIAFRDMINSSLRSSCMLVNSVEEIESKGMERLRIMFGNKPVWSIGPLLSADWFGSVATDQKKSSSSQGMVDAQVSRLGKKPGVSAEECTRWLDRHPPGSVVYVSFGSQSTVSTSQMRELASGLERSGKSFVWTVRPPREFELGEEFRASEWLPAGFEERMSERNQGLVVRNWAPQLIILAHRSTGAFLSHCGWNSVLESLSHGVPLIGWPHAAEQFYNVKMMVEEMGVCVELARGCNAELSSEAVAEAVRLVMDGDSIRGKELKRNAAAAREKMKNAVTSSIACSVERQKATLNPIINAQETISRRNNSPATLIGNVQIDPDDGVDDSSDGDRLGSSVVALNRFMEVAFGEGQRTCQPSCGSTDPKLWSNGSDVSSIPVGHV